MGADEMTIEMELFPELELGLYNGWILFVILVAAEVLMFLLFPRDVVSRLTDFDRSKWSKSQRISFALGKTFSLICIILIVLTPLKLGTIGLGLGIAIFAIGLTGLAASVITFRRTSPDRPVTTGPYRFSRHPQQVSLFTIFTGISIAIGSWVAFLALILSRLLNSAGDRAEEQACLEYYGDSYQEYMERVPRYLLFGGRTDSN
ncbi:MAG: isoprenylcysteine carboxylmethyltransferase family protein [Candidatus Thorarchaeota archaeon]|nr:MAG: isoprenylcysteine carboxylmethyltransferase family protein [Candidatus Thorarchaeota archaeon]